MWCIPKNLFLTLMLFPLLYFNGPAENGIQVNITGIRNNKGHLLVSLFNSKQGFPDKADKALRRLRLSITNGTAYCNFSELASGTYAIAILHDENDDLKLNTNLLGIPTEGYGFSNNVMGAFGPPSFGKAGISYTQGVPVSAAIRTRYGF